MQTLFVHFRNTQIRPLINNVHWDTTHFSAESTLVSLYLFI